MTSIKKKTLFNIRYYKYLNPYLISLNPKINKTVKINQDTLIIPDFQSHPISHTANQSLFNFLVLKFLLNTIYCLDFEI